MFKVVSKHLEISALYLRKTCMPQKLAILGAPVRWNFRERKVAHCYGRRDVEEL